MKELSECTPQPSGRCTRRPEKSHRQASALDEEKFRCLMNEDAMATEKTAEGIRKFAADITKLEQLVARKLNG